MKNRALKSCLLVTTLIIILLITDLIVMSVRMAIPWMKEGMENSKIDRTVSVVPDEETAMELAETAEKLAYVLIEANLGWEQNCSYEAEITFDAQSGNWTVHFCGRTQEGNALPEADRTVVMNRGSGEVVELYGGKMHL